jgi:hypothetical protein
VRSQQVYEILKRASEISGWSDFVVIGSQAIHGTIEDPEIEVVLRSDDVDVYPRGGWPESNAMYEELMLQLGQDSDFHLQTDNYIEAVSATLARFPNGWEGRAIQKCVGTFTKNGEVHRVNAIFPEIHDLTVAKLVVPVHRDKDVEFMESVVKLGLVDQDLLMARLQTAPRTTAERIREVIAHLEKAYAKLRPLNDAT